MSSADPDSLTERDFAGALAWWREAGLDFAFTDEATRWLAEKAQPSATPAAKPPAVPGARASRPARREAVDAPPADLLGPDPPTDLASFREWWLTQPGLDEIGPRGRIAPHGEAGARLMVLVMDPEEGDRDRLLSQSQGRLLSRMLDAMGIAPDEVYLASALPRHTPMADGTALAQRGMGAVLHHHVRLVEPQAVISFGANILPLLGHEAAQDPASLEKINHEGGSVPLLAAEGLDAMMAMPRLKARFWRRWLEWTGKRAQ